MEAFGGPWLEWGTCWRCGAERQVEMPMLSHMHLTAYGWCCHYCLVSLPSSEWQALLKMNGLANELAAAGD